MFSTSVLFAVLAGSAFAAPLVQRGPPKGWATGYLEDYDVYHERYLALNCHDKHDTTFFQDCCRPMLATENLADNRKAYCTPSTTESAAAAEHTATATATDGADADAQTGYGNATSSVQEVYQSVVATATAEVTSITLSTSSIAQATSTSAIGDNQWAKPSQKTTEEWKAPTTTSTPTPEPTKAANNGPSGDVKTGGHATYFYQNGQPGACGQYNSDSDYLIAIDSNGYWGDFASNNNSPYCGRWINIKNTKNGNTVSAKVVDVCPTCVSSNSLDLSVAAFSALVNGDMGQGSIPIEWSFA